MFVQKKVRFKLSSETLQWKNLKYYLLMPILEILIVLKKLVLKKYVFLGVNNGCKMYRFA